MVDVRLWRRGPAHVPEQEPLMGVNDVVHQLDRLVDRLQAETDRLEAANDLAGRVVQSREAQ